MLIRELLHNYNILSEGYNEATKEFTAVSGDANMVNNVINQYE